jgi:hypothetical protein
LESRRHCRALTAAIEPGESLTPTDQKCRRARPMSCEMAAAGGDIVVLGGVPINLSRGYANAQQMIADLEAERWTWAASSSGSIPRPTRCCCRPPTGRPPLTAIAIHSATVKGVLS